MAPRLTPTIVQQLALVKHIYAEGVDASRSPHPLSATAVLKFHDAVELFLGLSASHLGVNVNPKIDFLEYWGQIKTQTTVALPGKTDMDRLNHARVGFKHKGNVPATQTIERCRDYVSTFFTTATPMVFGVDFEAIDMVDLVTQGEVARLLGEAQTHADIGDYIQAMAGLSLAFEGLRDHYSGNGSSIGWEQTPFSFGPKLHWVDEPRVDGPKRHDHPRLGKISDIAQETQEAMQVISLGIDFPGFARFKAMAPRVHAYHDGSRRFIVTKWDESITAEDYGWARQFVIESALRAARADGVRELLEAQMTANWRPEKPFPERTWTGPAEGS
ncbi:hypothetical protein [Streptomyces bullii]|uniref:Uncharacterized protein n=1 Tax=Streptomyces bullii TaxID=349910 RepID=A0ABW0UTN2_9ACTN